MTTTVSDPRRLHIAHDVPSETAERFREWHAAKQWSASVVLAMLRNGEMTMTLSFSRPGEQSKWGYSVTAGPETTPEQFEEMHRLRNLTIEPAVPRATAARYRRWFLSRKWTRVKMRVTPVPGGEVRLTVVYPRPHADKSFTTTGGMSELPNVVVRRVKAFRALGGVAA